MKSDVIIGVDGGGTHARLVAALPDGTILARTEGGGLNFNFLPVETVRENLREAIDRLCKKCGSDEVRKISLGLSALDDRADAATIKEFAGDTFCHDMLLMDSDVYVAMLAAQLGNPCVMVVSGTGSMIVGLDPADQVHVFGGWGYKLGEPGGGYGFSIHAIREILRAMEGYGQETALVEDAREYFGITDSRELINCMYKPTSDPSYIAGFARYVLRTAENGDAVAMRVVWEEFHILAQQTCSALDSCPKSVSLYGGVFEHSSFARDVYMQILKKLDRDIVFVDPLLPPEAGAVIMYLKTVNGVNADILNRMQETWRRLQYDGD